MNSHRKSVLARIQMVATENGGRSFPIFSGYRPNHNFGDEKNINMQMGQLELLSTTELLPGKEAEAKIEFVVFDESPFPIKEGVKWRNQEGRKVVAYGEMTKVIEDEKQC